MNFLLFSVTTSCIFRCQDMMFDIVLFHFQEIEPRCGEALCKLFPSDDNVDLNEIVREARRSKRPDFRFSTNRGRDSFRGRGDFRLGLLFELFNLCGRGVT